MAEQQGGERIYEVARQMTGRAIMCQPVITVTEDQSMDDVIALMLRHDINRIPIVRDGVPVGIVARHDLLRMLVKN